MHRLAKHLMLNEGHIADEIEDNPKLSEDNLMHLLSLDLNLLKVATAMDLLHDACNVLLKENLTDKERAGVQITKDSIIVMDSMLSVLLKTLKAA